MVRCSGISYGILFAKIIKPEIMEKQNRGKRVDIDYYL